MKKKLLLLSVVAASTAVMVGCGNRSNYAYKDDGFNFAGIIKYEPASYSATGPNTFKLRTDELVNRQNFSGDRTTLLWGLVTLTDY